MNADAKNWVLLDKDGRELRASYAVSREAALARNHDAVDARPATPADAPIIAATAAVFRNSN